MSRPNAWHGVVFLIPLLIVSASPRACSQEEPKEGPKKGEPTREPTGEPKGEPTGAPADGPAKEEPKGPAVAKEAPANADGAFVQVPPGQVWPGCTDQDYKDRHRGNTDLRNVLRYDIWGTVPAFPIGGFLIGRHEVTNAQWKHYLDKEFRVEHTAVKGDTLKGLASQYVQFRGLPVESEWKAIYALNWRTLVEAWKAVQVGEGDAKRPLWDPAWPIENPPSAPGKSAEDFPIPEGLKLVVYRTRVPQHWYGWCRLSGLSIGREYYDPTKPAAEAFIVPEGEPFKSLALGDTDFAAYPARSASANEMLAFAEWAGCQLPSEYEWERAARGDQLRWPYSFGQWNPDKQRSLIAGGDNERCKSSGPMRVDDPSVSGSDSPFGARHVHGNVWELTRTWFDVHPRQAIDPPSPGDIANYALVGKGGSFGDRWQLLMVCARTGVIGNGELSLRDNNRADSLGLRLVRHGDRPGFDLMLHSLRRLGYDSAAAVWTAYPPHAFAQERIAGVDDVKIVEGAAPYVHARTRAHGVAVAPLWVTKFDDGAKRETKPERNRYHVLGAFRSDVPFKAGVCLSDADRKQIFDDREKYRKYMEEFRKLKPEKQKLVKDQLPPEPPPPDDYEKATGKHEATLGLFREKTVAPGEWFVVWWNGYIGLANKNFTMPPDAILMVDPKQVSRKNAQPGPSMVTLDGAKGEIQFQFQVWEQPNEKAKQVVFPGPERSEEWALYEACPSLFIKGGAAARPNCWDVAVALKIASGDDPAWKSLVPDAPRNPDPPKDPPGKDKKTSGK